jgi:hypothetical protein
MKAALLCNGPSREDFFHHQEGYDFIMGCNAPWYSAVDATVIVDEIMVSKWFDHPELINCKSYFSKKAWIYASVNKYKDFFEDKLIEIVDVLPDFDSSGHVATKILLKQGYDIDIWGADSWFENTIVSYTHDSYTPNLNADDSPKHIKGWREHWERIIENNPDRKIEFKRMAYV